MVPKRASARQTASWNVTPFSGAAESKTRLSEKRRRSAGTARRSLTASASRDFARSAACNAALPAMMVTRLEYEPKSTGPRSVSPVYRRISKVSSPRTSATMEARTSSEPWPISVAPQKRVTPPPRSNLSCTPECGILFQ